jgi:hypothetical protein
LALMKVAAACEHQGSGAADHRKVMLIARWRGRRENNVE